MQYTQVDVLHRSYYLHTGIAESSVLFLPLSLCVCVFVCAYKTPEKCMNGFSPNLVSVLLGRISPDDFELLEPIGRRRSTLTKIWSEKTYFPRYLHIYIYIIEIQSKAYIHHERIPHHMMSCDQWGEVTKKSENNIMHLKKKAFYRFLSSYTINDILMSSLWNANFFNIKKLAFPDWDTTYAHEYSMYYPAYLMFFIWSVMISMAY